MWEARESKKGKEYTKESQKEKKKGEETEREVKNLKLFIFFSSKKQCYSVVFNTYWSVF